MAQFFGYKANKDFNHSLVVGSLSVHVSDTIDEKCNVQCDAKSQIEIHPKRYPQTFVPKVPWH